MNGGSRSDCKPTFSANIQAYLVSIASGSNPGLKKRLELFNEVIEYYNLASTVFGADVVIIPSLDLLKTLVEYADPDGTMAVTEDTTTKYYRQIHAHLFALSDRAGLRVPTKQVFTNVDELPDTWYSYKRVESRNSTSNIEVSVKFDPKRDAGFAVEISEPNMPTIKAKFIGACMNKAIRGAKFVFEADETVNKKKSRVSDKVVTGGAVIKNVQQLRDSVILASKSGLDSMTRLSVSVVNGFYASIADDPSLSYLKLLKAGSPELSAFRILNFCAYTECGKAIMEKWGGVTCDYMLSAVWNMQEDASCANMETDLPSFRSNVLGCDTGDSPSADIMLSNYFALTSTTTTHYATMISNQSENSISEYLRFVYVMSGVELGRTTTLPVVNKFDNMKKEYNCVKMILPDRALGDEAKDAAMLEYLMKMSTSGK